MVNAFRACAPSQSRPRSMEIWQSCVVAPLLLSRWMVRGNPSTTVMLSPLTMPSLTNLPRDLSSKISPLVYWRKLELKLKLESN